MIINLFAIFPLLMIHTSMLRYVCVMLEGRFAQWLVHLPLMLELPRSIDGSVDKISVSKHTPLISFAGSNAIKRAILEPPPPTCAG